MTPLLLRLMLVSLLSYGTLTLQQYNNASAQTCGNSCPDDYQQEDWGDSCTNDYGTECSWNGPTDYCKYSTGCPTGDDSAFGTCCIEVHSPIVIDTNGKGFHLTGASKGVQFPITNTPSPYQTAWTDPSSHNSWLVLDRNGNGVIDDGTELFGNYTPQPNPAPGSKRNGFAALAVFDRPESGGNGDGIIDERDAVFSKLRLWDDVNHNGISEPDELFTLRSKGVSGIELHYSLNNRVDEYGNHFRYQAHLLRDHGYSDGRLAWDVFLSFQQ